MIANVWFLPSIISFIPIFFGWYTTEDQLIWNEKHPSDCVFVVNKVYAVVSSSISFWIPGIVMITMYYRIFKWVNIDSMLFQLQKLRISSYRVDLSMLTLASCTYINYNETFHSLLAFYRSISNFIDLHFFPSFSSFFLCAFDMHREAVRQRKALSRTSSNILLNSVHLQNQPYSCQPSNNRARSYNNNGPRHSECDEPNLIIKESQQECHSEISELEVNWFCLLPCCWLPLSLTRTSNNTHPQSAPSIVSVYFCLLHCDVHRTSRVVCSNEQN